VGSSDCDCSHLKSCGNTSSILCMVSAWVRHVLGGYTDQCMLLCCWVCARNSLFWWVCCMACFGTDPPCVAYWLDGNKFQGPVFVPGNAACIRVGNM
jgi:hypothetical protein